MKRSRSIGIGDILGLLAFAVSFLGLIVSCTPALLTFQGDCDVPPAQRIKPCKVEAQEYYVKESVNAKGTWMKQYYPKNSQTQMAHDVIDAISDLVPGK